jgi:protein-S-isoprenylcysteine O-methyltransferase Ste14
MKWFMNIAGAILILVGIVWFLQGLNVLLGSVMSGQPMYAVLGVVVAVVGAGLIYWANRRKRGVG